MVFKSLKKLNILIIGLQYPEPKSTAAGSRMMQIIQLLQSYGCRIYFATTSPKNEYSANLDELDIQQHELNLNDSQTKNVFKTINPDIVLFDRFITEEQFGWQIDECSPQALKLLDTEDLHFLREAREDSLKATSASSNPIKLSDKAKRELAAIYRCDLTLMISKAEIDILVRTYEIPEQLLFYLPLIYDTSFLCSAKPKSFEERQHFFSIGNFKHKPNLDMVMYLYNTIWPIIRKKNKNAEWHIYGAYVSEQVQQIHKPQRGVFVKGRAKEVLTAMSSYRVMLAPLRFGAGLKGKCLDAMHSGTPSISTPVGAEGITSAEEWPGFIAEDPQHFAKRAADLYNNRELWNSKQKKGFEVLIQNFDINKFSSDFEGRLIKAYKELTYLRINNIVGELLKHHHQRSTKFMSLWIEEKNK